jgi:DNA repair exonuclease SbcCD ATPase subunit
LAANLVCSENLPLILDEGLNGLDQVGKFAALELLNEIAQDRAVFIIDHEDTLKSALPTVWIVTHDNGVSSLDTGEANL